MMSVGRTSLIQLIALFAIAAMCLVCISDDSSAEMGNNDDHPPEERYAPQGWMPERKEIVAIDPGHLHKYPFPMVMDFEKVSAEKKHLESHGKEVFIIVKPEMGHLPVLDEIIVIIGQDRFLTPEQADSMKIDEIVEMDAISKNTKDDPFLAQVSEALSVVDPETAQAVDEVLSIRERMRPYETYQKAIAVGHYSTTDRRDDTGDEEDIEEKVIFEEEETEDREPVVFVVPIILISDGCKETGHSIGNPSAALTHGAADGPGL